MRRSPPRSRKRSSGRIDPDDTHLRRCLELALRGAGRTRPNPMVGSVVVRRGRIVGEAFHARAGATHAEAGALRGAGSLARGATLYSNLEPCSHHGRTPPCVEAIIASGISRVVVSHIDPDPRVRGRGIRRLRAAGVRVEVGRLRNEAMRLNEGYLSVPARGRPFVLVKAAITLDGRLATRTGDSRWISSPASRADAHRLRSCYDAVMIGSGTALKDDPLLTSRIGKRARARVFQPVRIVVDSRLRLRSGCRLLKDRTGGPVLVYTGRRSTTRAERPLRQAGAEIIRVSSGPAGSVSLTACLSDLARRGVGSVMIEGGGELIAGAFAERIVDKITWYVAGRILGGRNAVPVVGGAGSGRMTEAIDLHSLSVTRCGRDMKVVAYVEGD